jgi:hypothetical protein
MQRRKLSLAWALAGTALLASALPVTTALADATTDDATAVQDDPGWAPTFIRDEGNNSFLSSRTVPFWSSSFTDPTNGVTYPFTMVGTDPRLGGSTTVATAIIPLKFTFVAGSQDVTALNVPSRNYVATPVAAAMDGADNVGLTIASPIFTPAAFPLSGDSGVQYGDAVMRAQFGKVGTDYHVQLGQPDVQDTVSIDVPQDMGVAVSNPVGVMVGMVDADWFKSRLRHIINTMHMPASTLPIFLSNNVFLYGGTVAHCCILGGHGAGSPTGVGGGSLNGKDAKAWRTFTFAAYITPNSFPGFGLPNRGMSDIHALSHEIAELMNDPFGVNKVQPWRVPTAAPGTCLDVIETGDPVASVWFPLPGNPTPGARGVWHPADEVFLNWFARDGEDPGLAPAGGRYTYSPMTSHFPGPYAAFGHPAQAC